MNAFTDLELEAADHGLDCEAQPEPEPREPPRPCKACGGWVGFETSELCSACHRKRETERLLAQFDEHLAGVRRNLQASTHRCKCGAKILRAGELCDQCQTTAVAEKREAEWMAQTVVSVPLKYRWATGFDVPELRERVRDAKAIVQVRSAVTVGVDRVTLLGAAGVGKTVLAACALIHMARESRKRGVFIDAHRLATSRADAPLGEEPLAVIDAMNADALVLDDLGNERVVSSSPIPEVLHHRHAQMKTTIVTSGFDLPQIRSRYGDGLTRRLFEDALVVDLKRGAK